MRTTTTSPLPTRRNKPLHPRHWVAEWALTVLLLLFGSTTLLQAYVVPTGSMTDTVLIGDHVLVDKLAFAPKGPVARKILPYQEVRRGDIVVFRYPVDIRQNYVKRVIGVPGDRIRLENNQLVLNGRPVNEPYLRLHPWQTSAYLRNFPSAPPDVVIDPRGMEMLSKHVHGGELIVPPDQYFTLGDNRDESADSRFWGLTPRTNIIGKPVLVCWSYDAPTEQLAAGGLLNPEHAIDVALHFFTRTRWERSLKLLRGYPLQ